MLKKYPGPHPKIPHEDTQKIVVSRSNSPTSFLKEVVPNSYILAKHESRDLITKYYYKQHVYTNNKHLTQYLHG